MSERAHVHEAWRACSATCGRGGKFRLWGREQKMGLCLMMYVSPNAKVHGILAMLSPWRSSMQLWIAVTFVFHRVSHHLLQLLSAAVILCANAIQYADALLTLLHSFIKSDRSCAHIVRSRDCALVLCNLEIGTQFLDSENVQCNLEITQIPRLHGTTTHTNASSVSDCCCQGYSTLGNKHTLHTRTYI